MTEPPIRVAIVGAGLAGTILMNALLKYPHLDVQLYEAKSEITERGASVGLSINAQRALRLIGLPDLLKMANGVQVGCLKLIVGEGPDAGKLIYDLDYDKITVHRAALLKELMMPVPRERIHLNHKLASIQDHTITFEDGTTRDADVVIGADGIRSGVRSYVLGQGHPAINPVLSGFWDVRTIVSHDEAVGALGKQCIDLDNPHQHIHIGRKVILFHDIIDDGKKVCIVASGPSPPDWDPTCWTQTVTREWLAEKYDGWDELGLKGLDLLFGNETELRGFVQWESAEAPTLYRSHICMIGDAAHATSPWQGSGLSQAIEDCLILERVLGLCASSDQVTYALQAYDQVRREHAREVVVSSRKAAESYFSAHKGGVEQLRRDIPSRAYILEWDTEGAIAEAINIFKSRKTGSD